VTRSKVFDPFGGSKPQYLYRGVEGLIFCAMNKIFNLLNPNLDSYIDEKGYIQPIGRRSTSEWFRICLKDEPGNGQNEVVLFH
jgi:hypothetical protein